VGQKQTNVRFNLYELSEIIEGAYHNRSQPPHLLDLLFIALSPPLNSPGQAHPNLLLGRNRLLGIGLGRQDDGYIISRLI